MAPEILGAFLISLFVIVVIVTKKRGKKNRLLLNDDLPFPEAGQGSSLLSLTALFGCYLVMLYLMGLPAIMGVAMGSVLGLILIKDEFGLSGASSFHRFLSKRFKNNHAFLSLVATTQILFLISELVLLKYGLEVGLGIGSRWAVWIVVIVCLLAYMYCLYAGYLAVYQTDIFQFIAILIMCLMVAGAPLHPSIAINKPAIFGKSSELWSFGLNLPTVITQLINGLIGFVTGISFIVASPDTWKRVFVITKKKENFSFYRLIAAGLLPFILLFPIILVVKDLPSGVSQPTIFEGKNSSMLAAVFMVGIFASFLSTFDSILVSSVHLVALKRLKAKPTREQEQTNYNFSIGLIFMIVSLGFWLGVHLWPNPTVLATFLIGLFSVISGLIFGTQGFRHSISNQSMLIVLITALFFWFLFTIQFFPNLANQIDYNQISALPFGVLIAISVAVISRIIAVKNHNKAI